MLAQVGFFRMLSQVPRNVFANVSYLQVPRSADFDPTNFLAIKASFEHGSVVGAEEDTPKVMYLIVVELLSEDVI
jgi:hypothetical protein